MTALYLVHVRTHAAKFILPVALWLAATAACAGPSAGPVRAPARTAAEQEVGRACLQALRAAVPGFAAVAERVASGVEGGADSRALDGASAPLLQVEFNWGKSQRPVARCTWSQADEAGRSTTPPEVGGGPVVPVYRVWLRTADLYVLRIAREAQTGEQVVYVSGADLP